MSRKTIQIPGLQDVIATLGRSEVQRIVNDAMRFGRIEGFTEAQRRQWVLDSLDAELENFMRNDVWSPDVDA